MHRQKARKLKVSN